MQVIFESLDLFFIVFNRNNIRLAAILFFNDILLLFLLIFRKLDDGLSVSDLVSFPRRKCSTKLIDFIYKLLIKNLSHFLWVFIVWLITNQSLLVDFTDNISWYCLDFFFGVASVDSCGEVSAYILDELLFEVFKWELHQ